MAKTNDNENQAASDLSASAGSEFPDNYEPTIGDRFTRDGHECTIVEFFADTWAVKGTTNFGANRCNCYTTEELVDACRVTMENGGRFFPQNKHESTNAK